jgi:hypothetical protein
MVNMSSQSKKAANPHFSVLALAFFMISFLVARTFTTLSPSTVILVGGGIHIHHFWFGLILLAVGGWMGIVNQNQQIDQLAAVLYGAGGGLIADEVGLLLTFGDYWTGLTYTLVVAFLALVSLGTLSFRYRKVIRAEFWGLTRSGAILYVGIFLAAISGTFLLTTSNILISSVAAILAIVACVMILVYVAYRLWLRSQEMTPVRDARTNN